MPAYKVGFLLGRGPCHVPVIVRVRAAHAPCGGRSRSYVLILLNFIRKL